MIYKINTSDLPSALVAGMQIYVISATGDTALVKGESFQDSIAQYEDSSLQELLSDLYWKQPCTNCGE
jgi:hypothetical protein